MTSMCVTTMRNWSMYIFTPRAPTSAVLEEAVASLIEKQNKKISCALEIARQSSM
jgi:hypothetical protein